jgi:hypothetical protein
VNQLYHIFMFSAIIGSIILRKYFSRLLNSADRFFTISDAS